MIIKTPKYSLLIFLSTIWLFSYTAFSQGINIDELGLKEGKTICTNQSNTEIQLVLKLKGALSVVEGGTYKIQLLKKETETGNFVTVVDNIAKGFITEGYFKYEPLFILRNIRIPLFGLYKFRVLLYNKGNDIKATGESKSSYPIYYVPFKKDNIKLEVYGNDKDKPLNSNVNVCQGAKLTLRIEIKDKDGKYVTDNYTYDWFKKERLIRGEKGSSLELEDITESATYYARINTKGGCGDKFMNTQNRINVKVYDSEKTSIKIKIEGENSDTIKLCENQKSPKLKIHNPIEDFTYIWYKKTSNVSDDIKLKEGKSIEYTPPEGKEKYGSYYAKINLGETCKVISEIVSIEEAKAEDFEVSLNVPSVIPLLKDASQTLTVSYKGVSSASATWYKKGQVAPLGEALSIAVVLPGVYYAVVKDTSSPCAGTKTTEEVTVVEAKSLDLVIEALDYKSCESSNTTLQIQKAQAIGVDNKRYDLTSTLLNSFNYSWYKKEAGKLVEFSTEKKASLTSHKQNGVYILVLSNGLGFSASSNNELEIKLTAEKPNVQSTSKTNTICEGSSIIFSFTNVVDGFTYKWYKDDKPLAVTDSKKITVKEIGVYKLEVEGNGCNSSQIIEVKPFDENAIKTTPKDKLILYPNSKGKIVAEGADTYEWYNENNELVSTTETLETDEEGIYTLKVKSGICEAIKKIEVVVDEGGSVVQTIVSPNDDGINDTWSIPNKYAYQPNVLINIYNANGKLIYTTKSYKNDWPLESIDNQKIFYYQIIRDNKPIKSGTISVID